MNAKILWADILSIICRIILYPIGLVYICYLMITGKERIRQNDKSAKGGK